MGVVRCDPRFQFHVIWDVEEVERRVENEMDREGVRRAGMR